METGTRQWSAFSKNIQLGCVNNCRYCYARYNSVVRFKHCTADEWNDPKIKVSSVKAAIPSKWKDKIVMLPTTHDITTENKEAFWETLRKLYVHGCKILIVSKPRYEPINFLVENLLKFPDMKEHIEFRFSIGANYDHVLEFWEPGAPNFKERFTCLRLAFLNGFKTSVSAEPLLCWPVLRLYEILEPFITESFWIGKMNGINSRIDYSDIIDGRENKLVKDIVKINEPKNIRWLYDEMNGYPKIQWKDSIKKVLNLE